MQIKSSNEISYNILYFTTNEVSYNILYFTPFVYLSDTPQSFSFSQVANREQVQTKKLL
jgi:hypothetical protein